MHHCTGKNNELVPVIIIKHRLRTVLGTVFKHKKDISSTLAQNYYTTE